MSGSDEALDESIIISNTEPVTALDVNFAQPVPICTGNTTRI